MRWCQLNTPTNRVISMGSTLDCRFVLAGACYRHDRVDFRSFLVPWAQLSSGVASLEH